MKHPTQSSHTSCSKGPWAPAHRLFALVAILGSLPGCSRSELSLFNGEPVALGDLSEDDSETRSLATGGHDAGAGGLTGVGGAASVGAGGFAATGGAPTSVASGGMTSGETEPDVPPENGFTCACTEDKICDPENGLCLCPEGHIIWPEGASFCVEDPCYDVSCGGKGACRITESGLAQCACDNGWSGLLCDQKWHDFRVPPFTTNMTFDSAGNGWLTTTQGLLYWDFKSTLTVADDDEWQLFPGFYGVSTYADSMSEIILDSQERKWIPNGYSLTRLDDGGTPTDTEDDIWSHFQLYSGLGQPGITHIRLDSNDRLWLLRSTNGVKVLSDLNLLEAEVPPAIDGPEWVDLFTSETIADIRFHGAGAWIAGSTGLNYVTLGGTPLDESDDVWTSFSAAPALTGHTVNSIVVDEASGTTWFNTDRGVVKLMDGGDPLNESTNIWNDWAPQQGGLARAVGAVIGVDRDAGVWLRSPQGAAVRMTSGGGGDDSLMEYHPTSNPQFAELEESNVIYTIAPESEEKLWLTVGTEVHLFDNGGTALDASDDVWTYLGRPEPGLSVYNLHPLEGGNLQLQVLRPDVHSTPGCSGTEHLYHLDVGDLENGLDDVWLRHPLSDELPRCFTLFPPDPRGNTWFKEERWESELEAWTLLDRAGTADASDDSWALWPDEEGSIFSSASAVADPPGGLWIGDALFDYGELPTDKSDDQVWELDAGSPQALARDSSGGRWFGYGAAGSTTTLGPLGPLRYLDDGGTTTLAADDTWIAFTAEDGLPLAQVREIQIDAFGQKWLLGVFGDESLARLDDGGTPIDKSDDIWSYVTTEEGLTLVDVRSFAVAASGGVWIGGFVGLQYLQLNR
jgi:hypothetical protein